MQSCMNIIIVFICIRAGNVGVQSTQHYHCMNFVNDFMFSEQERSKSITTFATAANNIIIYTHST